MGNLTAARERMVATQIEARGLKDPLVLDALRAVPREAFVPESLRDRAYDDGPLAIGLGQTISQPLIVAYMIALAKLKGGEIVLEIGSGSGYAAAVLGRVAARVFAIERLQELADQSIARLRGLGADNVEVTCADGTLGWPERAPFDAILVSAAAPAVPGTLKGQLKIGGRLIVPVGEHAQMLVRVTRTSETGFEETPLSPVAFVPLIGAEGFPLQAS
jgi:protein-L-isoaspartate(D-aspartate) O-methyltransferase